MAGWVVAEGDFPKWKSFQPASANTLYGVG